MVQAYQWYAALAELIVYWNEATPTKCLNPRTRKSWADMTNSEKTKYLTAVQCMYTNPSKGTSVFPNAKTRMDDFAGTHIYYSTAPSDDGGEEGHGMEGPGIHFNGVFLPWHRYFLWSYESALINECGYTGAQPYWDWTLDNPEYGSSFEKSTIFDPKFGFGGNGNGGSVDEVYTNQQGTPPGNCIADGPFVNDQPSFGFGFSVESNSHCLIRNLNTTLANDSLGWTKNVRALLNQTQFWAMSNEMDYSSVGAPAGIHGAGHKGVGGEMANIWSAANDPLFYMHHAQLDHVWWLWQTQGAGRVKEIGGPIFPNGTGTVTEDYVLEMFPFIGENAIIHQVLDVANTDNTGFLCYTYEHEETGVAGYKKSKRMFEW